MLQTMFSLSHIHVWMVWMVIYDNYINTIVVSTVYCVCVGCSVYIIISLCVCVHIVCIHRVVWITKVTGYRGSPLSNANT